MVRALAALAALAATACYAPTLRDCTLSCADETECAGGQVCGADHLCAAPPVAGSCAALLASDAGVDARAEPADAARRTDAAPPRDAAPARDAVQTFVMVHLQIDGQGEVMVAGSGTCDSATGMPPGNCVMNAVFGLPLQLDATPYADFTFQKWSGGPCDGQGATCTFTPTMNVDIHVQFKPQT